MMACLGRRQPTGPQDEDTLSSSRPRRSASDSARAPRWPSRRHGDRDLKRDAVILAAARAFNRQGFHNTSLDDVAAALGVTKPTVYYYVESKEQLLFECFQAGLELIREGLRRAETLPSPARERLAEVLRHYARAVASDFGWCMVRAEDHDLGPDLGGRIKLLKAEIDRGLRGLLEDGMRDGSIGPCNAKMTAFAMAGAFNWIAHWYRDNQPLSQAQVAEEFVRVFEQGLLPRSAAGMPPAGG